MKKEKMKQICNYFMKGLLLCALVFGFWFMADAGVNADEVGIPKNFTQGTIEMVPFTKGENSNPYINITNNSDKPIKVTFEHNIAQTDHNYKLSIYVGNHECVSRQNPVAKDANVLYLYPYQRIEKACEVIFSSSASSSTSVTFYIKAAYLSKEVKKKEQAIGLNKNTAVGIPLSGMQNSLYEGVTVPGRDERWYKFNVSERAVINPTFELAEKERNGSAGALQGEGQIHSSHGKPSSGTDGKHSECSADISGRAESGQASGADGENRKNGCLHAGLHERSGSDIEIKSE